MTEQRHLPDWVFIPIILLPFLLIWAGPVLLIPIFLLAFIAALRTGRMPRSAIAMFTLAFVAIVYYNLLWALVGLVLILLPWLDHPFRQPKNDDA